MVDDHDDDLEDVEDPDPDIVELEALEDEDLIDDDELDGGLVGDLVDDLAGDLVDDLEVVPAGVEPVAVAEDDEEEDEEDEDLDPDDVEAGLDVILKDRLVVLDDDEEEDEVPDPEERAEGSTKVLPKRPGEFVCQSCFLVKHPSQLADERRMLCRDCV